jgi:hypothetical protein
MSSSVNPNGTLVTRCDSSQYAIQSSTNSSPITITLASAALTGIGDYVEVTGHLVNTGANGKWQVTNVAGGGTQITLGGTTGIAAGGATGYFRDFSVNPQITIPSTGDAATAASVGTPMSAQIAPAIPWLLQRTGNWRLHYAAEIGLYVPTTPGPGNTNGFQNYQWMTASTSGSTSFPAPFPITLPDMPQGETVYIDVSMPIMLSSTGTSLGAIYPIASNASGPYLYGYGYGTNIPYPGTSPVVASEYPYLLRVAGLIPVGTPPQISINWQLETLASTYTVSIVATGACTASVRVYRQ